jgi:hypothetical protein
LKQSLIYALIIIIGVTLLKGWITPAIATNETPSVELGPNHVRQANPGETILYNHILTNTGTTTDTFSVEVRSLQGFSVKLLGGNYPTGTLMLPLQVGAQMTTNFQVSLTVPLDVAGVTETTTITATSQLSPTVQDAAVDLTIVSHRVYLPLISKRWPPFPYQPSIYSINNSDGNGNYDVRWTEQPSRLADTYILQEATNSAFTTGQREVCTTVQQFCYVTGRLAGTYYYRVQGHNTWGHGKYSEVEIVTVLRPGTPRLNAIDNADGDENYTVSWGAAERTTSYTLQEDTVSSFESPRIVYQDGGRSWSVTNQAPGTYYYRVKANGPTGQSEWSNTQSVIVPPPPLSIGDSVRFQGAWDDVPLEGVVTFSEYRTVLVDDYSGPVYPDGIFVVALMDVTNHGLVSDDVGRYGSFKVKDSTGRQFDIAELEVLWAAEDEYDRESLYEPIQPGFTKPLVFVFDVLPESQELHLVSLAPW